MSETKTTSHLIGGFAGGLTSAVILQPFDLLKTRTQQPQGGSLRSIIKNLDGYSQLWRGTLPSALRTSIGSALYLASLHVFRSAIAGKVNNDSVAAKVSSSSLPKLSMAENLITGAFTRGFVGFITMPVTVLKVRFESTLYHYKSLGEATSSIFKTEGIRGFFNGFAATVARDAPYAGLYVLLYEQCKLTMPGMLQITKASEDNQQLFNFQKSALINSMSAFLAASLATTITAPFDTIKTRMQLDPSRFKGFFRSFGLVVRDEGVLKLFNGLSLRLTRKAFSAGIAWGIYEEIVKFVNKAS